MAIQDAQRQENESSSVQGDTGFAKQLGQLDLQENAHRDDVVVKCMQLSKVFRDFWMRNRVRAVDCIDLEINRGEVFGPRRAGRGNPLSRSGLSDLPLGDRLFGRNPGADSAP